MALSRLAAAAATVLVLSVAGCSSARSRPPVPFPAEADPCAAYCLVYSPPSYREVPQLVECKPAAVCPEKTWRRDIRFEEVCKPGCYKQKCAPGKCEKTMEVVVTPGRTDWVKTKCPCDECCWKPVEVPPCTQCCPVTVTERGVSYCAFTPPEYDVVQRNRLVCVDRPVYKPAQYKVCWDKEVFMPGQWAWKKRTDCGPKCGSNCGCGPQPSKCCPPLAGREGFLVAPSAD